MREESIGLQRSNLIQYQRPTLFQLFHCHKNKYLNGFFCLVITSVINLVVKTCDFPTNFKVTYVFTPTFWIVMFFFLLDVHFFFDFFSLYQGTYVIRLLIGHDSSNIQMRLLENQINLFLPFDYQRKQRGKEPHNCRP